jgi:hypothetical protein
MPPTRNKVIIFNTRRRNQGDGLNTLFRDLFDGAISSGWTQTGSHATVDGDLGLIGGTNWGDKRLKHTDGFTRTNGRTLSALVLPEDLTDDLAVGWATGVVADPTTDGHSLLFGHDAGSSGAARAFATPGAVRTIDAGTREVKPLEQLVIVSLRAQGAFYLVSTFADVAANSIGSTDPIGIPAFPSARLFWVDDAATTTPMYPVLSARTTHSYTAGNRIDDVRVFDVAEWASDSSLATVFDRMTRADSTTTLGGSWTADLGTWGISSNQGYIQTSAGFNRAFLNSGLAGDGIWHCRIKAPTTLTDGFGMMLRRVDSSNFLRLWNNGASNGIVLQTWVAGAFDATVASTAKAWVAGTTYEFTIYTVGNKYRILIDGVDAYGGWQTDANSRHLNGTGFGTYASNAAAGARWDDFAAYPHTITLPSTLQIGAVPHKFTVGATLMADTFTATNGTAISGRTPSTPFGSNTWAVNGTGFQVTSNALTNTNVNIASGSAINRWAFYEVGTPDAEITATVTTPAAMDVLRSGLLLRYVSAIENIHVRIFKDPSQASNDEIELWEYTDPTGVSLFDFHKINIGAFWATSTTYQLKVQCKGRMVHVYLGTATYEPVFSYHMTNSHAGTKFGIYWNDQDDGALWDNVTVKALT